MQKGGNLQIDRNRKKVKIAALFVAILICVISGFVVYKFVLQQSLNNHTTQNQTAEARVDVDETEVSEEDKNRHQVPADNPRFISIPDLGVDRARVVSLGLIPGTNQLDSPISIFDAGWFNESKKPGLGSGALLMDGHNGGPSKGGIFDNLSELKTGASIIIERGDGEKFTYKVVSNKQLTLDEMNDKNHPDGMANALESVELGKQGLNIITCVGNWLPEKNTFDQRVMLRAVLVN